MKKHSDKLNSSPPRDYSHLEHVAVWFGGYLPLLYTNILPPAMG